MGGTGLLVFPITLAFVFWFAGLVGSWRRTITCLVFSYAALIIASQHNAFVADMQLLSVLASEANRVQKCALGFALSMIAIFIVLCVLFTIMWGTATKRPLSGALSRLAQSTLTAIAGWTLGVMLAISLVTLENDPVSFPGVGSEIRLYADVVTKTSQVTISLITPWLPDSLPLFLRDWEIK
jgi:hypothetical protein